jgi:hypothetical protein
MAEVEMKMRIPAVYMVVDGDTGEVFEKLPCLTKEDAVKIGHKLATYKHNGIIKLKKHKRLINRLKGYSKYTTLKGEFIPIIEYEFCLEAETGVSPNIYGLKDEKKGRNK